MFSKRGDGRILAVDDSPEALEILRGFLIPAYQVFLAKNGTQALKVARTNPPPDLILLDIVMPGISGFEVCRRIKEIPGRASTPIIFLTTVANSDDVVRGFELGAADYVTKPFNHAELLARVRTHIELKRSRDLVTARYVEQRELLHILSHDLSNTFIAIGGIVEFLKAGRGERQELFVELGEHIRNGVAQIELVRNMRRLAERSIKTSPVELAKVLHRSLGMLWQQIQAKSITFDINVDEGIRVKVEPVSFVNSVLNNVLTNSIKFSEIGGRIEIRAQVDPERVQISVRDQGIGMPPGHLGNLFDVSKVTSRIGTMGEQGTGFGMPLMKRFVESYGGSVQVFSTEATPGNEVHGTEVIITLVNGTRAQP